MSPNTTGLAKKCRIFVIDKSTVVYTYQAATILCDRRGGVLKAIYSDHMICSFIATMTICSLIATISSIFVSHSFAINEKGYLKGPL